MIALKTMNSIWKNTYKDGHPIRNIQYQKASVRNETGIPMPTIIELNLGFSPWAEDTIDAVIMGAIAASITQTSNTNPD